MFGECRKYLPFSLLAECTKCTNCTQCPAIARLSLQRTLQPRSHHQYDGRRLRRHPHSTEILAYQHLAISQYSKISYRFQGFKTDLLQLSVFPSARCNEPNYLGLASYKIPKAELLKSASRIFSSRASHWRNTKQPTPTARPPPAIPCSQHRLKPHSTKNKDLIL